jgi:hypothetical protein
MLIRSGLSRLLLTTIVIVSLDGCVQPTDPAIPSTAIVSISEDSLFVGDHFTVTVDHELKGDSVKLFIGPFKCPIDSVVGSKIHATAVAGDGENQVRVYVNERLATGDFKVYLFDRSIKAWAANVSYDRMDGRIGDTIIFMVDPQGIDPATLAPRLNDVPLVLLAVMWNVAWYVIPDSAQDGLMKVRIFSREASLYQFDVIRPETDLPFEEGMFSSVKITIGVLGHIVRLNNDGSTDQFKVDPIQGDFHIYHNKSAALTVSDSIRFDHDNTNEALSRYCYLRMYFDPVTRLLSGKLSTYRRGPEIEQEVHIESMGLDFKDLAWYKLGGSYHLYATNDALSHISNVRFKWGSEGQPMSILGTYEASDFEEPFIDIEIAP